MVVSYSFMILEPMSNISGASFSGDRKSFVLFPVYNTNKLIFPSQFSFQMMRAKFPQFTPVIIIIRFIKSRSKKQNDTALRTFISGTVHPEGKNIRECAERALHIPSPGIAYCTHFEERSSSAGPALLFDQ